MSAPIDDTKGKMPAANAADQDPALDFLHEGDNVASPAAPRRTQKGAHHNGGDSGLITVQPLKKSEMQPSYAQDLGDADVKHTLYGSLMNGLGSFIGTLGQIPCCFCCPNPYREVQQGSVGLISQFGQFRRAVDPGLTYLNVCTESMTQVSVKIQLSQIPLQSIITKDNLVVEVDSVVYWHVMNPYRSLYGVDDVRGALVERAQTTLRDVVGSRNLQSVISDREGVALQVEEIVEAVAEKWGVAVESILIKDIKVSRELQQSLASAATQQRIGQSKIIAAKADVEAAKLLRQAADALSSGPALQIRELDALQAMSKQAGTKVIFVPYHLQSRGGWDAAPGTNTVTGAGGVPGPSTTTAGDQTQSPLGPLQQYAVMTETAEQ